MASRHGAIWADLVAAFHVAQSFWIAFICS
jgi:hypothetical protein